MIAGKIIARDVSERQGSLQHTQLMLAELNHRVKNTLASVQGIAVQTPASMRSLSEFRTAFIARLLALSNTHDLLAAEAWQGAHLDAIIRSELAPCRRKDQARVVLEGHALKLDSKAALALAMAMRELAINAGKYGALSVPDGHIEVTWKTRRPKRRPGCTWSGPSVAART